MSSTSATIQNATLRLETYSGCGRRADMEVLPPRGAVWTMPVIKELPFLKKQASSNGPPGSSRLDALSVMGLIHGAKTGDQTPHFDQLVVHTEQQQGRHPLAD